MTVKSVLLSILGEINPTNFNKVMDSFSKGMTEFNKSMEDFGDSMKTMSDELSNDVEKSNNESKSRELRNQENLKKIWG